MARATSASPRRSTAPPPTATRLLPTFMLHGVTQLWPRVRPGPREHPVGLREDDPVGSDGLRCADRDPSQASTGTAGREPVSVRPNAFAVTNRIDSTRQGVTLSRRGGRRQDVLRPQTRVARSEGLGRGGPVPRLFAQYETSFPQLGSRTRAGLRPGWCRRVARRPGDGGVGPRRLTCGHIHRPATCGAKPVSRRDVGSTSWIWTTGCRSDPDVDLVLCHRFRDRRLDAAYCGSTRAGKPAGDRSVERSRSDPRPV